MTPSECSPVHVWRSVAGEGHAVDYLRWLAAMWEQYRATNIINDIADARADFPGWLAGKFN